MTAPLFLRSSRRVYRPDEAQEKALAREIETVDPSEIGEAVFDGIKEDVRAQGIHLETGRNNGPTWSVFEKGAGVGLAGYVEDREAFIAYLVGQGTLTRAQGRRLNYVDREGGVSLKMAQGPGRYPSTWPEVETTAVEWPSAEIDEALVALESAWTDYVETLARKALRALEAEYVYRGSWETLSERLRDFDEGIDDEGRIVSLSECEEGSEGV